MPTVKQVVLYTYDELSDEAKEKAREWYVRAGEGDNYYAEWVYEDVERVGNILGIEFDQDHYKTRGGGSGSKPKIFYSGFWNQGDGACFEGSYKYKKGAAKKIRAYFSDHEVIRIADELQKIQKTAFYGLTASMKHNGHYMHSGSMRVEVERDNYDSYAEIPQEADIAECMRDFADWIYRQLELAYEDSVSEEVVAENIRLNGYTFTENGKRED